MNPNWDASCGADPFSRIVPARVYMQLPVRNLLECAKDLFLLASILKVRILEGSRVLDSGGNELDKFPSAMGTVTRLACELARQQGVETESLLRKAGLTSQQVDNPRSRLAVASQINFLDLAATALNDDCLGFHLAQHFDLRSAGLFYYVLASSDTLGEALQRGVRYSAIVNEGIRLRLRDGEWSLQRHLVGGRTGRAGRAGPATHNPRQILAHVALIRAGVTVPSSKCRCRDHSSA